MTERAETAATTSTELDDLCWGSTAGEVLAAYRSGDEKVKAIAARYGVSPEAVLALADEAGYASHYEMRAAHRSISRRGLPAGAGVSGGGRDV